MATLILTVAGQAIGGPIGAAIGSIVGQQIDRNILFRPKGREGPRLTELAVQTSSYGTPIPRLFGTIRVAGTVIWSTDLIESKSKSSSGKGQPTVTNYSYAVSFAVLLSARPIQSVGRIWADGKLLRGMAGDFKTQTGFRLHHGGEDQAVDPLIAAAEGMALTPAHRGGAYVVFENFQLADYGNRIPSLTFEIIADPGPVGVDAIAADISGGVVRGQAGGTALAGFSAYGDSIAGVLEMIALPDGAWFAPSADALVMQHRLDQPRIIRDQAFTAEPGAAGRNRARNRGRNRSIAAIETVPRTLMIAHYEAARDYQTSVQRARRPGAGTRTERIDLPAVLTAAAAKQIAQATIGRRESARETRRVSVGWESLDIVPGDVVIIDADPTDLGGRWRVDDWSLEAMVLTLDLVRLSDAILSADRASAGRALSSPDAVHGPTRLEAFDVPAIDDVLATAPRVLIAATGSGAGWRRAALLLSTDHGARYAGLGSTALPAVMGSLMSPLAPAPAALIDRINAVEVDLGRSDITLDNADETALAGGANVALIGDELLQFGRATPLGGARWRLEMLWRGRRGTDAAMVPHMVGDRFVLLTADTLVAAELPLAAIGGQAIILASGVGDLPDPAEAHVPVTGASLRPPSPVHLSARRQPDGQLMIRWVRRSRAGWRWIDAVETPLAEERELYRVTIDPPAGSAGSVLSLDCAVPYQSISSAAVPAGSMISVRQSGAGGLSLPAILMLSA